MTDSLEWPKFWALWGSGQWEPGTKAWIEESLQPGDLLLDVGAWIGPTTRWAEACGANVIAVEPDPIAFTELHRLLGHLPHVRLEQAALTVESGFASLRPNPRNGGEFGDSMSEIGDGGVPVVACDLGEILEGLIPTAVKIDVEGYEYELLPAILPQLARWRCAMHVSFHDPLRVMSTWFTRWDWIHVDGLDVTAGFIR